MKQSKNDRVVIGAVTIAAGLLFAGIGRRAIVAEVVVQRFPTEKITHTDYE